MPDVKDLPNKNKQKDPIESAINKIKETVSNEINKKIAEKIKAALDARQTYNTLKGEVITLIKEQEVSKGEINDLLKDLK